MTGNLISKLKNTIALHKNELFVILLAVIPTSLFVIFALIENNFKILDHSYWVGITVYNVTLIIGIWLAMTKRKLLLSEGILYVGLVITFIMFFFFRELIFTGDITQGVITGARMLWEGKNPYVVPEVPHADSFGSFRLGTYAYLPVDLLFYSLMLGGMNLFSSLIIGPEIPFFLPGFNEMGIVITNSLLMVISIYLIKDVLEVRWKQAILLGSLFFVVLIWNNVCLAQALFIAGWYFHKRKQTNLTVFFWSLSMLSKYFAGIFIVAYIIEYLRKQEYIEVLIKTAIPTILSIIVCLPFGIFDVLNSTVFFYNTEERMLDGSFGGSIVSELILFLYQQNIVWVYTFIWVFTFIGFFIILIIALLLKDLFQRLVVISCLALFVITGISAQFLPIIAFILILSGQIILFSSPERVQHVEEENTIIT